MPSQLRVQGDCSCAEQQTAQPALPGDAGGMLERAGQHDDVSKPGAALADVTEPVSADISAPTQAAEDTPAHSRDASEGDASAYSSSALPSSALNGAILSEHADRPAHVEMNGAAPTDISDAHASPGLDGTSAPERADRLAAKLELPAAPPDLAAPASEAAGSRARPQRGLGQSSPADESSPADAAASAASDADVGHMQRGESAGAFEAPPPAEAGAGEAAKSGAAEADDQWSTENRTKAPTARIPQDKPGRDRDRGLQGPNL
jgi:hypothetical protein